MKQFARKYGLSLIAVWTVIVALLAGYTIYLDWRDDMNEVVREARDFCKFNFLYRSWNASVGGIYVTVDKVSPNPYLHVAGRDVITTDGKRLTLVNPNYMTRMVFEQSRHSQWPIISKLTSLKPLNPVNAPDAWERKALHDFEHKQAAELFEVTQFHGKLFLRYISPFLTTSICIKCHGQQGYKVGDIRGALSVAIPLAEYTATARRRHVSILGGFFLLWIGGGSSLAMMAKRRFEQEVALKASEQKFRTVCDWTNDWEYWIGNNGEMHHVSPSCQKLTGYPREDFAKDPDLINRIIHPEDRQAWEEHRRDEGGRTSESNGEMVLRIVRKSGETCWISHSCRLVYAEDGSPLGRRVSNRDITQRREIEQEIRRLNEELEMRVVSRTEQLEEANRELEAFGYSVSHDLRAPLRAISGFTRILEEEYGQQLDAEGNRICERICWNARRMGTLVDDLLAFSQLGRTELQRVQIGMTETVRSIFAELASEKAVLKMATLPVAWGDTRLLQQVWTNLLTNALKFSAQREQQIIEVGAETLGSETLFFVRDNGAGFDPAYAHKLFGVFQRLHKADEFEGTGAGLAIVQRIIQRHGGRVWGVGQVGCGATFFFTLPAQTALTEEEVAGVATSVAPCEVPGPAVAGPGHEPKSVSPAGKGPVKSSSTRG